MPRRRWTSRLRPEATAGEVHSAWNASTSCVARGCGVGARRLRAPAAMHAALTSGRNEPSRDCQQVGQRQMRRIDTDERPPDAEPLRRQTLAIASYAPDAPFRQTPAGGLFADGSAVQDTYSGDQCQVSEAQITASAHEVSPCRGRDAWLASRGGHRALARNSLRRPLMARLLRHKGPTNTDSSTAGPNGSLLYFHRPTVGL